MAWERKGSGKARAVGALGRLERWALGSARPVRAHAVGEPGQGEC